MVCSVGTVKMAVMARLSASENVSQATTEKAEHQRLVAQYIQQELLEADDANLLIEEDMLVFDLNPLTDPLLLVCCNICKKPVKASQFVIHAELCRSLGIGEKLLSEFDSGTGNLKPPRKERKKSITSGIRPTLTGIQERFAVVDASETAVSSSQLEERGGITSSCFLEAKGTPGSITKFAGEIFPMLKRPKLIAADTVQPLNEIQTEQCVGNIASLQDEITYVPAPLATKTYYSQRNNRLQGSISHMYSEALIEERLMEERELQGNLMILENSSPVIVSEKQSDEQLQKNSVHSSPIAPNENQIYRQGFAVCFVKGGPGGGQSSKNLLNQFSMIDACSSQAAADGVLTTRYHPKRHPFAGESDG